jgi:hypothetical protein
MKTEMASVQNRSVGTTVLAIAVLYVFFVFSYVWFLPNYNLLRLGGHFVTSSHTTFRTALRNNNYQTPADNSVWLEKVSKTTPETKRNSGFVLFGTSIILAILFAAQYRQRLLPAWHQSDGYGIFAHQYAYLSLRTFRI